MKVSTAPNRFSVKWSKDYYFTLV